MRALYGLLAGILLAFAFAPQSVSAQNVTSGPASGGELIAYKTPGYQSLNERQKTWLDSNFSQRRQLGENDCIFGNFDRPDVITTVRGRCGISSQEVDQLDRGEKLLTFTVTSVINAKPFPGSTMTMECRRNDRGGWEKSIWAGRMVFCQVSQIKLSHGEMRKGVDYYAFFLVDLQRNGIYLPMGRYYQPDSFSGNWIYVPAAISAGNYPTGRLKGIRAY